MALAVGVLPHPGCEPHLEPKTLGVTEPSVASLAKGLPPSRPDLDPHFRRDHRTEDPAPPVAPTSPGPKLTLAERCARLATGLRRQLGKDFTVRAAAPFVVAGNMHPIRLGEHLRYHVLRPAELLWASTFDKRPTRAITILLFKNGATYRTGARALWGDTELPYYGYYKPQHRTLVMNVGTGSGTLVHELTHALMAPDFPEAPDWFNEGLASLHEGYTFAPTHIVGVTNWRLPGLQQALSQGRLRSLRALVTRGDFYGAHSGVNYAQARFFVQYLQHRRLLRPFYKYFRQHARGPAAGVQAIEHICGQPIRAVERRFLRWVRRLRYRPG